jgi:segregation and condensation protein A
MWPSPRLAGAGLLCGSICGRFPQTDRPAMDGLASDSAWDNWDARIPATGTPAAPMLHLDGFDGPMDLLLDLAERQKIDFGRMSVLALAEQFAAAMARFGDSVPIERRADWLVIATRLVLLRSRLLFPESPSAAEAAARDAAAALLRINDLAAAWLGDQPVLGQDVFARGAPDRLGVYVEAEDEVDVIAFLWATVIEGRTANTSACTTSAGRGLP